MTTGSSGGFLLAFLAAFEVRPGRDGPPGYPATATSWPRSAAGRRSRPGPRPGSSRPSSRWPVHARDVQGLVSPAPRTRPARCCCPASSPRWRVLRDRADPADQRRDLPRHRVRAAHARRRPTGRSAWETSREAVVSSFSKHFSMTGWRIGWMLVPDRLRRATDADRQLHDLPSGAGAAGLLAAFDDASYDELDGHVRRYAANRALLLDGLPRLGSPLARARGRRVLRLRRRGAPDRRHDGVLPRRPGPHRRRDDGSRIDFDTVDGAASSGSAFAGWWGPDRGGARASLHSRRPLTFLHSVAPATLPACGETPPPSGPGWPGAPRARRGGPRPRVPASASAREVAWRGVAAEALRPRREVRVLALLRTAALQTRTPPRPSSGTRATSTWPRPAAGAAGAPRSCCDDPGATPRSRTSGAARGGWRRRTPSVRRSPPLDLAGDELRDWAGLGVASRPTPTSWRPRPVAGQLRGRGGRGGRRHRRTGRRARGVLDLGARRRAGARGGRAARGRRPAGPRLAAEARRRAGRARLRPHRPARERRSRRALGYGPTATRCAPPTTWCLAPPRTDLPDRPPPARGRPVSGADSPHNGTIEVQALGAGTGGVRHIVYPPGTDDMATPPWTQDEDVRDPAPNLRTMGGQDTSYQQACCRRWRRRASGRTTRCGRRPPLGDDRGRDPGAAAGSTSATS